MTPISRRPIPRRCCIGRAKARKPSWRASATCCWTIDRGSSPTSARPTRRGPPNATAAVLLLEASASAGQHGRGGQGLRCGALRCRRARPGRHAPRGAEGPRECDRRSDHAACGLSRESAETNTRGTGLRLDEDRRRPAQAPASRHRHWWIGSSPSPPPPITWSGCGIWRRGVPDRRPRVSPAPSSPAARVAGPPQRYPGSSAACCPPQSTSAGRRSTTGAQRTPARTVVGGGRYPHDA